MLAAARAAPSRAPSARSERRITVRPGMARVVNRDVSHPGS
jgi:hypothetical protein